MTTLARFERGTFRQLDLRLTTLVGQSISLGTMLSLLIVTASSIFLTEFGSQKLPYVYIAVAILGSLVFYGYGELQRRFPLPALSVATLVIIALFFLMAWLGMTLVDADWISFPLMVSFSLIFQMGFVLLGNQAGRLFDVREVKGKFPRVVAGFAVGFLLGGFIVTQLANVIGPIENMLLLAMACSLSMLFFMLITDRRFHERLDQRAAGPQQAASKSLWKLLAKRFVVLVVVYQVLSAMVSQLLDFMLFDQAAARYVDSQGLAQFLGSYTVAVNVTDILFLALFAGLLLSRFGLNFGLLANPVVDGIILLVEIGIGMALGIDSGLFFIVVITARLVDITLTDGTTRGSINTAYQALPASDRVVVQTGVEGIGVPIALGITGVILLLFNSISGLTVLHLAAFTLIVAIMWVASAVLVYRGYARSLVRTLRRRALNPVELTLTDSSSIAVIESFLGSDNLLECYLALDMLETSEHQSLNGHLISLTQHEAAPIRAEAFRRIERIGMVEALPVTRKRLRSEPDPVVKAAAVRALCALDDESVEEVVAYLGDNDPEIRYGAAVGLLRYGGIPGVLAAGEQITVCRKSPRAEDRRLVARIIGDVRMPNFYQPLIELISDDDVEVRREALVSAGLVGHPRLLPPIIDNLERPGTGTMATEALIQFGDLLVPYAEKAVADEGLAVKGKRIRLVRACGQIGGHQVVSFLLKHLADPDPEMRDVLYQALSSCDYQAAPDETTAVMAALREEVVYGAHLLVTQQDLTQDEVLAPLIRALADELEGVKNRVFQLLSLTNDSRAIFEAERRLRFDDGAERALAVEALDVMLPPDLKGMVLALLDPRLTPESRASRLARILALPSRDQEICVTEIVANSDGRWQQPWIQACAIYAAGKMGLKESVGDVEEALAAADGRLRQTAAWALNRLAPEKFEAHMGSLLLDPDPQVAQLAAFLSASRQ